MRARAGDPPRTMAQKILAGRTEDPTLAGETIEVKVDQLVLARAPLVHFAEALGAGLKRTPVEVAVVYDGTCVQATADPRGAELAAWTAELVAHGLLVARPGVGFVTPVHLERFASPARLCVTDEPRLAAVGGIGMLTLVVPSGQLGHALARGTVWLRPPRSIQILVSGRTRPFVCARDVSLELVRRGLGDLVRAVEAAHRAPVVLEFAGPSVRLLSVAERSVLAAIAPKVGAAAAVFLSDERTEVFLRDQRRSKAHRALFPDAGAPCDDVLNIDLGAVDPLLLDETGEVRPVRDLAGKAVGQVVLGGDSGVTLRDLFAAATLLKAKRVPSQLEFLLAVPSRQELEVLAGAGILTDLIATGARLVEPDARMMTGALYPPPRVGLSVRTCESEPGVGPSPIVASAETLAYAVSTGELGDPRAFKRPVRVTVPRTLPTDDVLVVRERRGAEAAAKKEDALHALMPAVPWKAGQTLDLMGAEAFSRDGANGGAGVAVVCGSLEEVRQLGARAHEIAGVVRAVLAPFIPSGLVALFSGAGMVAFELDAAGVKELEGRRTLVIPAPGDLGDGAAVTIEGMTSPVLWLARGRERTWVGAGTARVPVVQEARSRKAR